MQPMMIFEPITSGWLWFVNTCSLHSISIACFLVIHFDLVLISVFLFVGDNLNRYLELVPCRNGILISTKIRIVPLPDFRK